MSPEPKDAEIVSQLQRSCLSQHTHLFALKKSHHSSFMMNFFLKRLNALTNEIHAKMQSRGIKLVYNISVLKGTM